MSPCLKVIDVFAKASKSGVVVANMSLAPDSVSAPNERMQLIGPAHRPQYCEAVTAGPASDP
jgi:hypothetical protein